MKYLIPILFFITILFNGCNDSKKNDTFLILDKNSTVSVGQYPNTKFKTEDVAKVFIATYNKTMTYEIMNNLMEYPTLEDVAHSMHPDLNIYPNNQNYTDFVKTLYNQVFSRTASDDEVKLWVDKLYNGEILKKDMWLKFVYSATGKDLTTIKNKIEVSKFYADLGKGEDYSLIHVTDDNRTVEVAKQEILLLKDQEAILPDATQNLTPDEDHIYGTGGYDVIEGRVVNGNVETLQTIDFIDGGAGRDLLRATCIKGSSPTVKNVEEIKVRFAGDDTSAKFDLVNTKNVEKVSVELSTIEGTVAGIHALKDFEVLSTEHNINFADGTSGDLNLKVSAVGLSGRMVDINFSDNQVGFLNIDSVYSNYIYEQSNTGSTVGGVNIKVTGPNRVDLKAGKDTLQKITVQGNGSLDLTSEWFKALQSLTTEADVGTIKLNIDNSDGATIGYISTADGADEIMIRTDDNPLVSSLSVSLGAGDDQLIIMASDAGKIPSSVRIDGQGGMNKLGMNSDVATSLEDGKQEEGFDDFDVFIVIDELDGNVNMAAMDDIQMVVLANKYKSGSAISGLESGAYVTFTTDIDDNDGDTNITLSGNTIEKGSVDVYNLNFVNTQNTDFGDIIANYVETLNFMANKSGVLKAAITDGSVKTINITGTATLDIKEKALPSVTKLTAGDAGVLANLAGGQEDQTVITGSGNDTIYLGDTAGEADSKNTADLGHGNDTLTGGNGVDEVDLGSGNDVYNSSGGVDYITFGTGRDTYVAQHVSDSQGDTIDRIMDFVSGEDIFDFSIVVDAADTDGGQYVGEAEDYPAALSKLDKDNNKTEAVLDLDKHKLYIDVNSDGDISKEDMIINLDNNKVEDLSSYDFKFE